MEYIHTDVTDGLQRLSSDAELHQGLLRHREVGRRPGRSHAAEGGRWVKTVEVKKLKHWTVFYHQYDIVDFLNEGKMSKQKGSFETFK